MSQSIPPPEQPTPQFVDSGTAGSSARREYERRKANRERRAREKHPRIGGLLLALNDEPQHQRAWERGAGGEEKVAELLAKYLDEAVLTLHDRRIPGSRANIDHIAIASSGVWVIDAKRYKGKVEISRPLFGSAKLLIAGRDKTKLIEGLDRQTQLVRGLLNDVSPTPPVHGALCFIDADLPILGKCELRGYPLLYARGLSKRINRPGPVAPSALPGLAQLLAGELLPA